MANKAPSRPEEVARIINSLPPNVDHSKFSIVSGACIDILMSPKPNPEANPRPEHEPVPEQKIHHPN